MRTTTNQKLENYIKATCSTPNQIFDSVSRYHEVIHEGKKSLKVWFLKTFEDDAKCFQSKGIIVKCSDLAKHHKATN